MIVQPSGYIQLLKGVPLNNTYDHSIRFTSKQAQRDYFGSSAVVVKTFSNQSYTRVNKGIIRISANAEELYDCNYMAFQNNGFLESGSLNDGKWFYAFITAVEYHSNNATDITFEIDVLQTYMFDYDLAYCFVEREHSVTDNRDDWLVPENLETGEYRTQSISRFNMSNEVSITLQTSYDVTTEGTESPRNARWDSAQGNFITGHQTFDPSSEESMQALTEACNNGAMGLAGVINAELVPEFCRRPKNINPQGFIDRSSRGLVTFDTIIKPTSIDGYIPANKKTLAYPYTCLVADDNMGHTAEYLFEYFLATEQGFTDYCQFDIIGTYVPTTSVWAIPYNYKGLTDNFSEALVVNGFPTCAINYDSYKAWIAQHKSSINTQYAISGLKSVGGLVTAGVGVAMGSPKTIIGGAENMISGIGEISKINAEKKDKNRYPIQSLLKASNDSTMNALGVMGITFSVQTITKTMAKVIDDYFSMFGYATHRVKKPNLFDSTVNIRPTWNYLKTVGCDLGVNNCPAEAANKICSIFDKGITFWNNPANVGKYNLNNAPV